MKTIASSAGPWGALMVDVRQRLPMRPGGGLRDGRCGPGAIWQWPLRGAGGRVSFVRVGDGVVNVATRDSFDRGSRGQTVIR